MKLQYLIFIIITTCFLAPNVSSSIAAATSDWGDVVNVRYSLYLDEAHTQPVEGNVNQELRYIYLAPGINVIIPKHVIDLFPDQYNSVPKQLHSGYLDKFEEGIIGMQINQEKNVLILAADGYTQQDHQLYNKNLYFKITLLAILFDASTYTSTTTTRAINPSDPLEEFGAFILIGGGTIIVAGGFLYRNMQSSRKMKRALTEERNGYTLRQETIQKEKSQLEELRKITESYAPSEEKSVDKTEMKFRRRR